MSETKPTSKPPAYTVVIMDQTFTYDGRIEAVTAAKEASNAGARRVEVMDGGRREMLTYRDGRLVEYVFEARGLRREKRRDKPEEEKKEQE